MDLLYIVFCFALAIFNLFRGLNGMNILNFIYAAMWLGIGIVLALRYGRKNKNKKER